MAKQPTGIDDTLSLEAVYFPCPIPSGQAALVVMAAVFDKVYFPGVYLPKGGYDVAELDKEIARLEALPMARDHDTSLLIGTLKLTKYAKALEGFCEFTGDSEHIFGRENDIPKGMVEALYNELYGPPPPDFIPTFSTGPLQGDSRQRRSRILPRRHPLLRPRSSTFWTQWPAASERHTRPSHSWRSEYRAGRQCQTARRHSRHRVH